MKRSHGTRQGTRSILSKSKSQRSRLNISKIMHSYSDGDKVSIVIDGAQQKGMPHRRFQGATGTVKARQGRAYVVSVKDKNMAKTLVVRPEHMRPADGRPKPEFVQRQLQKSKQEEERDNCPINPNMLIMPKSGTYFFRPRKEGMSCPMNSKWLCSIPSGQRVRSEVESKLTLRYSRAYPKHSNQTINSATIQMSALRLPS